MALASRMKIFGFVELSADEEMPTYIVEEVVSLSLSKSPFIPLQSSVTGYTANNLRWEEQVNVGGFHKISAPFLVCSPP
jgi:hypothetical protein